MAKSSFLGGSGNRIKKATRRAKSNASSKGAIEVVKEEIKYLKEQEKLIAAAQEGGITREEVLNILDELDDKKQLAREQLDNEGLVAPDSDLLSQLREYLDTIETLESRWEDVLSTGEAKTDSLLRDVLAFGKRNARSNYREVRDKYFRPGARTFKSDSLAGVLARGTIGRLKGGNILTRSARRAFGLHGRAGGIGGEIITPAIAAATSGADRKARRASKPRRSRTSVAYASNAMMPVRNESIAEPEQPFVSDNTASASDKAVKREEAKAKLAQREYQETQTEFWFGFEKRLHQKFEDLIGAIKGSKQGLLSSILGGLGIGLGSGIMAGGVTGIIGLLRRGGRFILPLMKGLGRFLGIGGAAIGLGFGLESLSNTRNTPFFGDDSTGGLLGSRAAGYASTVGSGAVLGMAMGGPIGALIGGSIGLIAALYDDFAPEVNEFISNQIDDLSAWYKRQAKWMGEAWDSAMTWVEDIPNKLAQIYDDWTSGEKWSNWFSSTSTTLSEWSASQLAAIESMMPSVDWAGIGQGLRDHIELTVKNTISFFTEILPSSLSTLWTAIQEGIEYVTSTVYDWFGMETAPATGMGLALGTASRNYAKRIENEYRQSQLELERSKAIGQDISQWFTDRLTDITYGGYKTSPKSQDNSRMREMKKVPQAVALSDESSKQFADDLVTKLSQETSLYSTLFPSLTTGGKRMTSTSYSERPNMGNVERARKWFEVRGDDKTYAKSAQGIVAYANDALLNATQLAIDNEVAYNMGSKDVSSGLIDCSGWVELINKGTFESINRSFDKAVFDEGDFSAVSGHADAIITQVADRTDFLLKDAEVTVENLKEGMLLGLDTGMRDWERGQNRKLGVDHILNIVKGKDGRLYVSQSTSSDGGVSLRPLGEYLEERRAKGDRLYATDPMRMGDYDLGEPQPMSRRKFWKARDDGARMPYEKPMAPEPAPAATTPRDKGNFTKHAQLSPTPMLTDVPIVDNDLGLVVVNSSSYV